MKRGYADVSFGQVHYRVQGNGKPLILVHQSPRSSFEYRDLVTELSKTYTVYAPDNPGNGMSDPLPLKAPTMRDYAAALLEFMDAVNIKDTALYGYHTGGSITAAAAALYPDRIAVAVANGLAILEPDFRAELLERYLPEIHPANDGSHLSWLWKRIMDQAIHFPWYQTGEHYRLNIEPYSAYKAHEILLDFLMAGNDYIAPYAAAFQFDAVAEGLLPADNLIVVASKTDPLFESFKRLPKGQSKQSFETPESCLKFAFRHIAERYDRV